METLEGFAVVFLFVAGPPLAIWVITDRPSLADLGRGTLFIFCALCVVFPWFWCIGEFHLHMPQVIVGFVLLSMISYVVTEKLRG